MTKVLLYSGGMDSYLIDKLWKPDIKLYIDINGTYTREEMLHLPHDVKVVYFPLGMYEQKSKYIPMRNLYFLMIASNYGDEICLGATSGDRNVPDKNPKFFDEAEEMMNFLLAKQSNVAEGRTIRIERTYMHMDKNELVDAYLKMGGTLDDIHKHSFSCYAPVNGKPCYHCKPCFRKYVCLANRGYEYTDSEKRKMFEYMKNEMVPRTKNQNNTYYSERFGEGEIAYAEVVKLFNEFNEDVKDYE